MLQNLYKIPKLGENQPGWMGQTQAFPQDCCLCPFQVKGAPKYRGELFLIILLINKLAAGICLLV